LNWINNRRWFDNDQDRSPAAERMYIDELREFRMVLIDRTSIDDLRNLNLLGHFFTMTNPPPATANKSTAGVQFAICEGSKYFYYLRYEAIFTK